MLTPTTLATVTSIHIATQVENKAQVVVMGRIQQILPPYPMPPTASGSADGICNWDCYKFLVEDDLGSFMAFFALIMPVQSDKPLSSYQVGDDVMIEGKVHDTNGVLKQDPQSLPVIMGQAIRTIPK